MSADVAGSRAFCARSPARKPLVVAALALLLCLYTTAIYAPLLANDRPYFLTSIDVRGYAAAKREVVPLADSFAALSRETSESWLARRMSGSTMSREDALRAEARALESRLDVLRRHTPESQREPIENCSGALKAALAAASSGLPGEGASELDIVLAEASRVRRTLPAVDRARPDEARELLVAAPSWPLFASLTGSEWFLLTLWPGVIAVALLAFFGRGSHGSARTRTRRAAAIALGGALLVALAGATIGATVGGGRSFATAPYRQAIERGDLLATRAIFAPIALGFAETNLTEAYAPPRWSEARGDNERGAGERGAGERGDEARGEGEHRDEARGDGLRGDSALGVAGGEAASTTRDLPATRHWLGTDSLGRDVLARLLWGGRVSLSVGLFSALLLTALGTAVGAVAGYFGGWIDLVISRAIEVFLCFPSFLLILLVSASSDPAVLSPEVAIVLVIALIGWTGVARLARAEFLRLRDREFVVAARALGFSSARTIVRHVLPNALGPVLVAASFAVASGVLIESALSFLGVGIAAPIPSWGSLINESRNPEHWWIHLFPGLAIFATVVGYNLVGEAIRDALDPREQVRAR